MSRVWGALGLKELQGMQRRQVSALSRLRPRPGVRSCPSGALRGRLSRAHLAARFVAEWAVAYCSQYTTVLFLCSKLVTFAPMMRTDVPWEIRKCRQRRSCCARAWVGAAQTNRRAAGPLGQRDRCSPLCIRPDATSVVDSFAVAPTRRPSALRSGIAPAARPAAV